MKPRLTLSGNLLRAARRLYRNRHSTGTAQEAFSPDATCKCKWCSTVRGFLKAGSADYQNRRPGA